MVSTQDNSVEDEYDQFQCLEILKGQSICDFNYQNPKYIEKHLGKMRKDNTQETKRESCCTSNLHCALENDKDGERIHFFKDALLFRQQNEISRDIKQITPLERCLMDEKNHKLLSAQKMIEHMKLINNAHNHAKNDTLMMQMFFYMLDMKDNWDGFNFYIFDPENDQANYDNQEHE